LIEFRKVRHVARPGKDSRTLRASPEAHRDRPKPCSTVPRLGSLGTSSATGRAASPTPSGVTGIQPSARTLRGSPRCKLCTKGFGPSLKDSGLSPQWIPATPSIFQCSPSVSGRSPNVLGRSPEPPGSTERSGAHRRGPIHRTELRLTRTTCSLRRALLSTGRGFGHPASLDATGTFGFHRALPRAQRSRSLRTSLLRSDRS
jgi:hypothetical protein